MDVAPLRYFLRLNRSISFIRHSSFVIFLVRDVENNLDQIHQQALKELESAESGPDIEDISIRYLGRKGILTQFLRNISKLPAEQRPPAGKKANKIKNVLDKALKTAAEKFASEDEEKDTKIDVSLPGRISAHGTLHPITQVNQEMCDIFSSLGFDIGEGPESRPRHPGPHPHAPRPPRHRRPEPTPPVRPQPPARIHRRNRSLRRHLSHR